MTRMYCARIGTSMPRSLSIAFTSMVTSPRRSTGFVPNSVSTPCARRSSFGVISTGDGVRAPDLVLQLHDAVEKRLCSRRATGHVDIHGHDTVAAAHDGVRIVVIAAAVGARAHRDHPARLSHLVVDLAKRRRHLVAERSGNDHQVG